MEAWKGHGVRGQIILDDVSFREVEAPLQSTTTSATTTSRMSTTMDDATSVYTGFPCAMDKDPGSVL